MNPDDAYPTHFERTEIMRKKNVMTPKQFDESLERMAKDAVWNIGDVALCIRARSFWRRLTIGPAPRLGDMFVVTGISNEHVHNRPDDPPSEWSYIKMLRLKGAPFNRSSNGYRAPLWRASSFINLSMSRKRPWCEWCGAEMAEVLCPTCTKWWAENPPDHQLANDGA